MASRAEKRKAMRELIERWRRSGEPGVRFARRHGIGLKKFEYWKRQFGAQGRQGRDGAFVPVRVVGAAIGAGPLDGGAVEVVLADGARVVVREGASIELVRGVLAALRAAC